MQSQFSNRSIEPVIKLSYQEHKYRKKGDIIIQLKLHLSHRRHYVPTFSRKLGLILRLKSEREDHL